MCVCVCVCVNKHTHTHTHTRIQKNYYNFQPPKSCGLLIPDHSHCPKFQSRISMHVTTLQPEDRRIETRFPAGPETSLIATAFWLPLRTSKLVSSEWRPRTRPHRVGAETLRCPLTFIQSQGYEYVQYTSIPQYTFTALRLIKQRNIFNFFLHTHVTSFVSVTTNHSPGSHSRLLYAVCIMQLKAASHKSCCQ